MIGRHCEQEGRVRFGKDMGRFDAGANYRQSDETLGVVVCGRAVAIGEFVAVESGAERDCSNLRAKRASRW